MDKRHWVMSVFGEVEVGEIPLDTEVRTGTEAEDDLAVFK